MKNNREDLEVVAYEREREKKYEDLEESGDEEEKSDKTPEPDPIRNETVRIMTDLIELSNSAKTASAKSGTKQP